MELPSVAAWQESGTYIDFQGYKIFVRDVGQGQPIIFLHGFPTSSYDFALIAPALEKDFRLIFLDFLGYGFSGKPQNHNYSIFEYADIVETIAQRLELSRVYVVTHDLGNSVTLELFRRETPIIERIVMLNGSVLLDHYRPVITQKLLLNPVIGPIVSALNIIRRPVFARQFGKIFAEQPSDDEIKIFWDLIKYNNGIKNYHLLIRYLNERKIHEHTWLDALKAHSAPITLIWGQQDPVSVPKIAEAVLERRPDTDYHPLAESGHYPQWEMPEKVVELTQKAFKA